MLNKILNETLKDYNERQRKIALSSRRIKRQLILDYWRAHGLITLDEWFSRCMIENYKEYGRTIRATK